MIQDKHLLYTHAIEGNNNNIWFSTWYMCWRLDNDGKNEILFAGQELP